MVIKAWVVRLRHDGGTIRIRTMAQSAEAALRIVLAAEGCAPESAVISVRPSRTPVRM